MSKIKNKKYLISIILSQFLIMAIFSPTILNSSTIMPLNLGPEYNLNLAISSWSNATVISDDSNKCFNYFFNYNARKNSGRN